MEIYFLIDFERVGRRFINFTHRLTAAILGRIFAHTGRFFVVDDLSAFYDLASMLSRWDPFAASMGGGDGRGAGGGCHNFNITQAAKLKLGEGSYQPM